MLIQSGEMNDVSVIMMNANTAGEVGFALNPGAGEDVDNICFKASAIADKRGVN